MKFLPDEKQPKAYYATVHRHVGTIDINDGLVDITDPCYNEDMWCALFGYNIKPGKYNCYVNIGNFPSKVKYNADDIEVRIYGKVPNYTYTLQDRRIIDLIIEHIDQTDSPSPTLLDGWELVSNQIGVDAGMCGFYNHKPNFYADDWSNFWQNLKDYPHLKNITCDIKPYGITVSSGFGDGCYEVYKVVRNGEIVALRLKFC